MAKKSKAKPAKKSTAKKSPAKKQIKVEKTKSTTKKVTVSKPTKKLTKPVKVTKQKPVVLTKESIVDKEKHPLSIKPPVVVEAGKNRHGASRIFEYLVLLVLFGIAIGMIKKDYATSPRDNSGPLTFEAVEPVTTGVTGKYLFTGTIVWDRNVEEWSKDDTGTIDPAHPFSNLSSYNPEAYDAWVTDLECPTSAVDVPYELGLRTLEFNCRQEYLPFAAEYFKFMNLANNHSDNSGRDKLEETREALDQQGIQYFGDPDPSVRSEACEVVGLPVRVNTSTGGSILQENNATLPVAFCAWHYFLRLPEPGEIEELQRYSKLMPVFAFLHMGPEYKTEANKYQVETARNIIDAGADFVIANNPHWVQNAESYKGKLIVYSTGNFIFDQTWNREVSSSVSIDAEVNFNLNESTEDWLALGESCVSHGDDCLMQALEQGLQKQKASFKYTPIAGTITENIPQNRADTTIQEFIEARLGWKNVLAGLAKD